MNPSSDRPRPLGRTRASFCAGVISRSNRGSKSKFIAPHGTRRRRFSQRGDTSFPRGRARRRAANTRGEVREGRDGLGAYRRKVREKGGHNSILGPNVVTPSPKRSRRLGLDASERCVSPFSCHCFCQRFSLSSLLIFRARVRSFSANERGTRNDDAAKTNSSEESMAARYTARRVTVIRVALGTFIIRELLFARDCHSGSSCERFSPYVQRRIIRSASTKYLVRYERSEAIIRKISMGIIRRDTRRTIQKFTLIRARKENAKRCKSDRIVSGSRRTMTRHKLRALELSFYPFHCSTMRNER